MTPGAAPGPLGGGLYRVLIVDDEDRIREVLKEYAAYEGFEVEEARDGLEAVQICKTRDFDAIVMDIMMPRLDGFSASKEIRRTKDIPVLMLSARGEVYDKLFGFELGIDDYVVKPFSPKEVMARLHVLLQRNRNRTGVATQEGAAAAVDPLQPAVLPWIDEGLVIDFTGRKVWVDEKRIDLPPKEFDLLCCMARNRGSALTREKLLNEVWGFDFFGDVRTVDTHVKMLRRRLGRYRNRIATLRGVGYRYEA